jgi:hypothetical protein
MWRCFCSLDCEGNNEDLLPTCSAFCSNLSSYYFSSVPLRDVKNNVPSYCVTVEVLACRKRNLNPCFPVYSWAHPIAGSQRELCRVLKAKTAVTVNAFCKESQQVFLEKTAIRFSLSLVIKTRENETEVKNFGDDREKSKFPSRKHPIFMQTMN